MILTIFLWIILSILVGIIGSSKKLGGLGAFLISLVFSPIIGILFVIASPVKNKKKKRIDLKTYKLFKQANKHFKNKNYNEAITIYKKVLALAPKDPVIHSNLAAAYSLTKQKEEAFNHLSKSVKYGYNNFRRITDSKSFEWLRNQPEFNNFVTNGYTFVPDSSDRSYISELKELIDLKEKGIISEKDFETLKNKIIHK